MMPGIRLRERLSETTYSGDLLTSRDQLKGGNDSDWGRYTVVKDEGRVRERSHQGVADFLGEEGIRLSLQFHHFTVEYIDRLLLRSLQGCSTSE